MKTIISILIGCTIIYLLGSFYSVSFNLKEWTEATRYVISTGMLMVIVVVLLKDHMEL